MNKEIKPSLLEVALKGKRALILGLGGGGDVIQGIPAARLFQQLGYEEVLLGGINCQWWMPDGAPQSDVYGTSLLGPTLYDIHQLHPSEKIAPQIRIISRQSAVGSCQPAEAVLADILPGTQFVGSLNQGVVGLA